MTEPHGTCHTAGALLLLLLPTWTSAAVVDSVNAVRAAGCEGHHGRSTPLRPSARLDEVARGLSRGAGLAAALERAGYHAVSSFSVSISNVSEGGEIEPAIARQFCQQFSNPALQEIGTWRVGGQVWIALAQPFAPPAAKDQDPVRARVLNLTNEARARPRRCGSSAYAAAAPLALDDTLSRIALAYARDMARFGYMQHTGRDGSSPAERISRGGYHWTEVGENLASGVITAEEVVAGWLASPEHCANLMNPLFRELGVAYAVNPADQRGVYWAMELGTPR